MYSIIDQLQENESDCYVVDFLPQKMDSNTYFEIEQIFFQNCNNKLRTLLCSTPVV